MPKERDIDPSIKATQERARQRLSNMANDRPTTPNGTLLPAGAFVNTPEANAYYNQQYHTTTTPAMNMVPNSQIVIPDTQGTSQTAGRSQPTTQGLHTMRGGHTYSMGPLPRSRQAKPYKGIDKSLVFGDANTHSKLEERQKRFTKPASPVDDALYDSSNEEETNRPLDAAYDSSDEMTRTKPLLQRSARNLEQQDVVSPTPLDGQDADGSSTDDEDKVFQDALDKRRRDKPRRTEVYAHVNEDLEGRNLTVGLVSPDGSTRNNITVMSPEELAIAVTGTPRIWYHTLITTYDAYQRMGEAFEEMEVAHDQLRTKYDATRANNVSLAQKSLQDKAEAARQLQNATTFQSELQTEKETTVQQATEIGQITNNYHTAINENATLNDHIHDWKKFEITANKNATRLRQDRNNWRNQAQKAERQIAQLTAEVTGLKGNAGIARPSGIAGPQAYFLNPEASNRNLRNEQFIPCDHGAFSSPPDSSTARPAPGYGMQQPPLQSYAAYVPEPTFPYRACPTPPTHRDPYKARIEKFSGKPTENYDVWKLQVKSALEGADDWTASQKMGFIRDQTQGNAFESVFEGTDPSSSTYYNTVAAMWDDLDSLYNNPTKRRLANNWLYKEDAHQTDEEDYMTFVARFQAKTRVMKMPADQVVDHLKRLMRSWLLDRVANLSLDNSDLRAFNNRVAEIEADNNLARTYKQQKTRKSTGQGKRGLSPSPSTKRFNEKRKETRKDLRANARSGNSKDSTRKPLKELLKENNRTQDEWQKFKTNRACVRCGGKDHLPYDEDAPCKNLPPKPSSQIEFLKRAHIHLANNTDSEFTDSDEDITEYLFSGNDELLD